MIIVISVCMTCYLLLLSFVICNTFYWCVCWWDTIVKHLSGMTVHSRADKGPFTNCIKAAKTTFQRAGISVHKMVWESAGDVVLGPVPYHFRYGCGIGKVGGAATKGTIIYGWSTST